MHNSINVIAAVGLALGGALARIMHKHEEQCDGCGAK
jgi:hypothetical protein